ncbi:phage portal protein [Thiorhodococcus fuscus]|uniref:Phage portal protein n=1 Tax=Thiorhodococcus fuscus TaxID=527200 RepID=A0ABW4Y996_9GAMM
MNALDRFIALFAPHSALRRAQARHALRAYEATSPSRLRTIKRARFSADSDVRTAGLSLREAARWLEQNYDLVDGALDVLVRAVVGTGIIPEPLVRLRDGSLATNVNEQLTEWYATWAEAPEVTGEMDAGAVQRIKARTLFRDGEVFTQHLPGEIRTLRHLTDVPYSIELIDPEAVPIGYSDPRKRIIQGVQKNGWGRPLTYFVARIDPATGQMITEYVPVPAARMDHLKIIKRLRQTRGVTVLASAIERLEDVRDYDETERVAAKIAASMAAFIKRGTPDLYNPETTQVDEQGNRVPREHKFQAGMIFDFLESGEDIGTIDTNRPNPNLGRYRDDQLRAGSAGIGLAFSSFARNYEGNYSSRRQEANEQAPHYHILWDYFCSRSERPIWRTLVDVLLANRMLELPRDIDLSTLYAVDYSRPATPAIDRQKEVGADANALETFQDSLVDVWRRNGRNPADMWRKLADQAVKLEAISGANPSAHTSITPDPTDDAEPLADGDDESEREEAA